MDPFMKIAFGEAVSGMDSNEGGPFGALVVLNGEIIAQAHNEVIKNKDPTAHAEILAIRRASKKLGRFDLSDCELYTTCEPCPMCFGAIHWARIGRVYYGCSRSDAADIGFSDKHIYDVIQGKAKQDAIRFSQVDRKECLKAFELWENKPDKTEY
jgi:guanine deaminase